MGLSFISDRPSIKCATQKTFLFFIWIQWKLVNLYSYLYVLKFHEVSMILYEKKNKFFNDTFNRWSVRPLRVGEFGHTLMQYSINVFSEISLKFQLINILHFLSLNHILLDFFSIFPIHTLLETIWKKFHNILHYCLSSLNIQF